MDHNEPVEILDPLRKKFTGGNGQMRIYRDRLELDQKKKTAVIPWSDVCGFNIHHRNGSPYQLGIDVDPAKFELTRAQRIAVSAGGQAFGFLNGLYSKDMEGLAARLEGYRHAWVAENGG